MSAPVTTLPGRQDQRPLDRVPKLADVARPRARLEPRHGVLGELLARHAGARGQLLGEVGHQGRHVLEALAQRRAPRSERR